MLCLHLKFFRLLQQVGSLVSCFLARNGFNVSLFEMREDVRLNSQDYTGKSINLAISERGRSALRALGIEDQIIRQHAIPMRARMIHDRNGRKRAIPYGRKPEDCIYSVSRRFLNQSLLNLAQSHSNVNIYFHHKLLSIDFESGRSEFLVTAADTPNSLTDSSSGQQTANSHLISGSGEGTGIRKIVHSPVVIGADGAFSSVRKHLMKAVRMNFSQTFIDHGYIELNIPATSQHEFAMEVNYLHIWPRDEFMMIALPNQDKSFTVTLFMPFESFERITCEEELLSFFQKHFPDSIDLIGKERLIQDFFGTKAASLVSIKCCPIHLDGRALLIGDAAHAMVPFFGQGMNCGFEDCLILHELMSLLLPPGKDQDAGKDSAGNITSTDMRLVFREFQTQRNEDHQVICDLAMYNYIEMRHLVNLPSFLLRKRIDHILNRLLPRYWIPLYEMVTFSRMPYRLCVEKREQQDRMIRRISILTVSFITITASLLFFKSASRHVLHA